MNTPLTARHCARAIALTILALFLSIAKPAMAGDFAEREIIGFSPDGRYFAFEQYGVQDGSGFAYADIFIIDTSNDEWIKGSPVRVLLKDDSAPLSQARADAAARAGNLLRQLNISKPGRLLASNPAGELSADPHLVEVNASQIVPVTIERWIFRLEETAIANAQCAAYTGDPIKGFRLTAQRSGGAPQLLHNDTSIPSSRRCPLRYAISDIVLLEPVAGARIFAVLVSVYSVGFEGPDRRFLAVTRALN